MVIPVKNGIILDLPASLVDRLDCTIVVFVACLGAKHPYITCLLLPGFETSMQPNGWAPHLYQNQNIDGKKKKTDRTFTIYGSLSALRFCLTSICNCIFKVDVTVTGYCVIEGATKYKVISWFISSTYIPTQTKLSFSQTLQEGYQNNDQHCQQPPRADSRRSFGK